MPFSKTPKPIILLLGLVVGMIMTLSVPHLIRIANPPAQPLQVGHDVMRKLYEQMKPVPVEGIVHRDNVPLLPDSGWWTEVKWYAVGASEPVKSLDGFHGRLIGLHGERELTEHNVHHPAIEVRFNNGQPVEINMGFNVSTTNYPLTRIFLENGKIRQGMHFDATYPRRLSQLFDFDAHGRLSHRTQYRGMDATTDQWAKDVKKSRWWIGRNDIWVGPDGPYLHYVSSIDGRLITTKQIGENGAIRYDRYGADGEVSYSDEVRGSGW